MGKSNMRMFQVDAFTDRVFSGNPAAVLVHEGEISDSLMQAIASENNLSETAFARERSDGEFDLRWFTPVHEADFCGHATLATAHVLASEIGLAGPFLFHTRMGVLTVACRRDRYRLDIPALAPEPVEDVPVALEGVFERPPSAMFKNFENYFAVLDDEQAVKDFVPDLQRITRIGPMGLAITARGVSADFVSRYFAPYGGIPEDPVTGSTHATLVPYWSRILGKVNLTAFQASRRGGWLVCSLAGGRVALTGHAATYMSATIHVDDRPGSRP